MVNNDFRAPVKADDLNDRSHNCTVSTAWVVASEGRSRGTVSQSVRAVRFELLHNPDILSGADEP
jgi:hypothetical protein